MLAVPNTAAIPDIGTYVSIWGMRWDGTFPEMELLSQRPYAIVFLLHIAKLTTIILSFSIFSPTKGGQR